MITLLTKLIETEPKQLLTTRIKINHPELFKWIFRATEYIVEDISFVERIYIIVNNLNPYCDKGNKKTYRPKTHDYGFCGNGSKCQCINEHNSKRQKGKPSNIDIEKRKLTWVKKYGVDNPSKCKEISIKRIETMKQKDYSLLHSRLAYDKETVGYEQIIERVKHKVEPMFTREDYIGCSRLNKYKWKCIVCGNEFSDHIDYGREPVCKICFPESLSTGEKELYEFLINNNITCLQKDRTILNGLEIDILCENEKIGIEFNGTYWHSSLFKTEKYHYDKKCAAAEKNIRLIHIDEDLWVSKKDIIKNRLLSIFNLNKKIYARKCEVKEISTKEYKNFLTKNHIQGSMNSSVRLGLFNDDMLIFVMGLGKSRYTNDEYEIHRMASSSNVIGGASKLFSYFVRKYNPYTIISYSDYNWGNGDVYLHLNFKEIDQKVRIGYWYVKNFKRWHRSSFTKAKLVKMGNDKNQTESKIMANLKYFKIYDCGSKLFRWTKP